jgi:predicted dehydrogenase
MTRRTLLTGLALPLAAETLKLGRPVRLAMIGLQGHPEEITWPLDSMPEVDVVAIQDGAPASITRFKRNKPRLANVRAYTDYRRMLDVEKPDVVAVCNNDGARAGAILECLHRKLHVIAEKPLAIDRRDYEKVKTAVREAGVKIGMLLPLRYDPPYRALKQIVDSGEIGEVIQMSSQKSYQLGNREEWYKHQETYGSTILWIGIHMIDLMAFTSGRKFVAAASFMGRIGFPNAGEMETTTVTAFRLDNGGAATLHMDYCMPATAPSHGDDRLRLAGTKGIAEYMAATGTTLVTGKEKPHRVENLPPRGSVFRDFIAHVYSGAPATLTEAEIYSACDATFAAHDAAVQGKIVQIA